MRYGLPVSEFLQRHSSAELTELVAHFALKANPPADEPQAAADPEQQSRLLKQALFKGK